jgi:hypothetical protein
MANNYTEFSFSIPLATPAECEWVETLFANPPEALRPDWCEPDEDGEWPCDLEFDWEIDPCEDGHELFIYSQDGQGNTDKVEEFFKIFLAGAPTELEKLGAEFSYRCDKPRPDQFGGAAVVVWIADGGEIKSEWTSTSEWLQRKLATS